ncbi:MAG: alpha-hydroxy-acid oxidizing protein, partial [Terracidiphilus sp.]
MTSFFRNRRQFLRFLAASPLLSQAWPQENPLAVASARDALSVMDFEAAARKALRPAHWGFLSGGVDGDATLRANLEGFKHFQLRPRRLVDVSKSDLRTELFGKVWDTPIFLCPVGGQKTFHLEGEVAVARAAKARKTLQILANVSSSSLEDVTQALGTPPWYQL